MQGKFRKKPVVIDVVSVQDVLDDVDNRLRGGGLSALPDWAQQALRDGVIALNGDGVRIKTLESGHGHHYGDPTDIVIRGVRGELYPCKAPIFAETYESTDVWMEMIRRAFLAGAGFVMRRAVGGTLPSQAAVEQEAAEYAAAKTGE